MIAIAQHDRMGESLPCNLIVSVLFSSQMKSVCKSGDYFIVLLRADPAGSGGRQLGRECSSVSKEGTRVHSAGGEEEGFTWALSGKSYF